MEPLVSLFKEKSQKGTMFVVVVFFSPPVEFFISVHESYIAQARSEASVRGHIVIMLKCL